MSQSLCCLVCLQKHETIFREIVCTATLTIEKQLFPRSAFCRGHSPRSPCFRRFLGSSGVTNFGRGSPCHAHPVQPIKSEVPFFPIDPKVINPSKKSDVVLRHLNCHTDKFETVTEIKMKLIEEFGDQVPSQLDFSVGYYDGNQQAKTWLVTKDDLDALYTKYPNGENVALWCDGRSTDSAPKRKRDLDSQPGSSYRQGKEEEAEAIYAELREKHGSKYDAPRLRLWARMISTGLHSDYDTPPEIPAFLGSTPKRACK